MNSRRNQQPVGGLSPSSANRLFSNSKRIVMKGWRQKVSNNLKRNSLTTSYSSSSDSLISDILPHQHHHNNKITKKKKRVSSTFKHALQRMNTKPQEEEEISFECEEDVVNTSTTALNTIQQQLTLLQSKKELVNGHSNISPSLNETETAEPITTLTQQVIITTSSNSSAASSLAFHPEKETQQYETMENVQDFYLSQDNVSNSNQEDDGEGNNQDVDMVGVQDDEEEEFFENEVSDSFQLFSDNISRESNNSARANYLANHPNVKPQYRRTVIDWFNILQTELDIPKEILYHASLIFDRSLDRFNIEGYYQIDIDNLQALGCACFFLSTKYYGRTVNLGDILPPVSNGSTVEELKEQVIKMESWVVNALNFEFRSILLIDYIALFIHGMKNDQNFIQAFTTFGQAENFINCMEVVSNYLIEIQLHNYDMLWFRPSLVALSCFVLAFQLIAPRSNYKSVAIIREFLKIYFREMSRIERTNIDENEQEDHGQSQLVIEINEFNNCMKRCLHSMTEFEQLSMKKHSRNREHFKTITKYYQMIEPYVNQPEQLIELSLVDLQQWN